MASASPIVISEHVVTTMIKIEMKEDSKVRLAALDVLTNSGIKLDSIDGLVITKSGLVNPGWHALPLSPGKK